jgi:hypothetical protein
MYCTTQFIFLGISSSEHIIYRFFHIKKKLFFALTTVPFVPITYAEITVPMEHKHSQWASQAKRRNMSEDLREDGKLNI